MSRPVCPYCCKESRLVGGDVVYPHRSDLFNLRFWMCVECDAYVGCHKKGCRADGVVSDGTLPLGRLANASLRKEKQSAHGAFDPLWKNGCFDSRRDAYRWLAKKLGVSIKECHIGLLNESQCREVVKHCDAFLYS